MFVGILDRDIDDVAGGETGRHVAQEHVAIDLGRVGLTAPGRADVAILVGFADFIDDDGQNAADLSLQFGGADARRPFHDPLVAFFLDLLGHCTRQVVRCCAFDWFETESADAVEAQRLQLREASERQQDARQQADTIAQRLSILAGVPVDDITIDLQRRRALVTAQPLEGATLGAYRELERRVAATEPDWDIRIVPPLRALPEITFNEEAEPDAAGRRAIGLAIWAQRRIGIPLRLRGPEAQVASVRQALVEAGIQPVDAVGGDETGGVQPEWLLPE